MGGNTLMLHGFRRFQAEGKPEDGIRSRGRETVWTPFSPRPGGGPGGWSEREAGGLPNKKWACGNLGNTVCHHFVTTGICQGGKRGFRSPLKPSQPVDV